ncbi:MAG: glucosaminidase domain-containing protein [Pseudomonadales bacterium]
MLPWLAGLALHLTVAPSAAEPGAGQAVPVSGGALPPFHRIGQVEERKREFFDYLTPLIRMENQIILAQRARLLSIYSDLQKGQGIGASDRAFLRTLGGEYRLADGERSYRALLDALLERVDVIPRSLVLAQAAKESGWGSSRFARSANNLFGQWCFERGCGLVPRDRPAGQTHEVRKYASVRASVRSYVRNLNTHPSYEPFRQRRAALRSRDAPLCGVRLAEGLERYSARGSEYVREVQALIVQNDLESAWSGGLPARAMSVSAP